MFSTDDEKSTNAASTLKADVSPLATMDEPVAVTSGEDAKSVVRNMNTGEIREVKWVDPAMAANTNPLQMSW